MAKQTVDPFIVGVGEALGVPPDKIRLKHTQTPGQFTCIGPKPKFKFEFPDLPYELEYCFTFVLKLPPPIFACEAWRQEYEDLKQQLAALIQAEAWDAVQVVAQKLEDLKRAIERCRDPLWEQVITYCIFPVEVG
jgi:hypothetical protein